MMDKTPTNTSKTTTIQQAHAELPEDGASEALKYSYVGVN
jgi:hypothetical protein